jgi:ABC-type cobalamin transport system permease subunit
LCWSAARLAARLALKSAKNPMGVRVVTVGDNVCVRA